MTTNSSSITGEQVVEVSNSSQRVQQNREHSTSQDYKNTVLVEEEAVQNIPNIDASDIQTIENRNIVELERQEVPKVLSIVDSEQQTLQQAANNNSTIVVSEQNRQETIVRNAEGQQLQESTSNQMILGAVPEALQTIVTSANIDIVQ